MKSIIAVFGSGQIKADDPAYEGAYQTGYAIAQAGFDICNGGYAGTMEASAHGAKEAGGKTIGIISSELGSVANRWIDEVRVLPTWRERLFALVDIAKGYVILDGATGTLLEFSTVWEMANKKFHSKPVVIVGSSMQALFHYLNQKEGFVANPWIYSAHSAEAMPGVPSSRGSRAHAVGHF